MKLSPKSIVFFDIRICGSYEGGTSIIGIDQVDKLVSRSPMIDQSFYFAKVDPVSQSHNNFCRCIFLFLLSLFLFKEGGTIDALLSLLTHVSPLHPLTYTYHL